MKIDILILIVLYEKKLVDSISFKTTSQIALKKSSKYNIEIIVWDNSNSPQYEINENDNFEYIFKGKNERLSIIYNKITQIKKFTHCVILDDDTNIPVNYFDILSLAISKNTCINLFVPQVINNGVLVSPGHIVFVKGKLIKEVKEGLNKTKNFTVITSGMCVTRKYLEHLKFQAFDERLSLYGIDTKFMKDFRKIEEEFYILEVVVNHDTALRTEKSINKLTFRYENLLRSWLIVYSDSAFEKVAINIYVFYHIAKFTLRYRTLSLLKMFVFRNNHKRS